MGWRSHVEVAAGADARGAVASVRQVVEFFEEARSWRGDSEKASFCI